MRIGCCPSTTCSLLAMRRAIPPKAFPLSSSSTSVINTTTTTTTTTTTSTSATTFSVINESIRNYTMRPPGKMQPTPPPLRKLPPAPPLPGKSVSDSQNVFAASGGAAFKSPHDVLNLLIEFVPTFYVPIHAVGSVLSDEAREFVRSKGKAANFFRRYRFFFDLNVVDGGRFEIRLRGDVQHPRRGAADDKFSLADIGENATYTVVPEFVNTLESIDSRADVNVNVSAVLPPPSLHVRLQERVPVLERLKAMIPENDFVILDEIEERIPEDILTHPYFDVQGGLSAIATKFPDTFQVVEGQIRIRPAALAPLALDDFSFDTSPEPDVIAIVKKQVCASDIPTWVSVTGLYEQLSMEQRRRIKKGYKSFASFLRSHGSSIALSNDLLRVSHWIPRISSSSKKEKENSNNTSSNNNNSSPPKQQEQEKQQSLDSNNVKEVVQYTQLHVLNELYDRFPRGKELSLHDFLNTAVPDHLKSSLPKNPALWLATFPQYFVVEGATTTKDPSDIRIRRARDHAPIDIALQLYPHIPEEGIAVVALTQQLPPPLKAHVEQFGIHNIVENLPEWLELLDGDLFRTKSMEELEATLHQGGKTNSNSNSSGSGNEAAEKNAGERAGWD